MPTVNVFPVAATAAGTPRISNSFNYNGRDRSVMLQLLAPNWLTDNPSRLVTLAVQESFDSGASWADLCRASWNPRTLSSRTGSLPAMACWAGDNRGARLVRAFLSVDSGSLQLGVDATT